MSDKRKKLTAEQVEAIRAEYKGGAMLKDLAERFHVTSPTIWSIVNGFHWKRKQA